MVDFAKVAEIHGMKTENDVIKIPDNFFEFSNNNFTKDINQNILMRFKKFF